MTNTVEPAGSLRLFRCDDGWALDDEREVPHRPIARCMSKETAEVLRTAIAAVEPTGSDDAVERVAFEKWVGNRLPLSRFEEWSEADGEYEATRVQTAWEAWQARAAVAAVPAPAAGPVERVIELLERREQDRTLKRLSEINSPINLTPSAFQTRIEQEATDKELEAILTAIRALTRQGDASVAGEAGT